MKKLTLLLACFYVTATAFAQEIVQARLTHEEPVVSVSILESSAKVYVQRPGAEQVPVLDIPAGMILRVEADMHLNPPEQLEWRQNKETFRGDVIVSVMPLNQPKRGESLEARFAEAPLRMELRDVVVLVEKQ